MAIRRTIPDFSKSFDHYEQRGPRKNPILDYSWRFSRRDPSVTYKTPGEIKLRFLNNYKDVPTPTRVSNPLEICVSALTDEMTSVWIAFDSNCYPVSTLLGADVRLDFLDVGILDLKGKTKYLTRDGKGALALIYDPPEVKRGDERLKRWAAQIANRDSTYFRCNLAWSFYIPKLEKHYFGFVPNVRLKFTNV